MGGGRTQRGALGAWSTMRARASTAPSCRQKAGSASSMRRMALFSLLADTGAQVWMTGTELAPFDAIRDEAAIWRVSGGGVERV